MINRNILIINPTGGSPKHGPNMRSYNLAKNLIAKGCKVTVISNAFFHKFHKLPITKSLFTKESIGDVEYIWVKTKPYNKRGFHQILNQLQFSLVLFLKFKRLKLSNIDCVICSSPPPFAIFPAKKIAKYFDVKLIFEIRDLWPEVIRELSGVSSYHPYIMFLKYAAKFAYREADNIVSVKKGEIEILNQKYGVSESKFNYIPNGYDLKDLNKEKCLPDNLKKILHESSGKFVLAYVGSLSIAYDIEFLIKAAHKLKDNEDICFIIAGDGPEEKSLKEYCHANSLKNVEFLGRVPGSYIQPILKKASVGFLGYKKADWLKYGVSSNKIFDYMACKLPIIASLETKYNPVIEASCGISVNPSDHQALTNAILEMKNKSRETLNEMGVNGYEYLSKNHSFESIALQYIELFK